MASAFSGTKVGIFPRCGKPAAACNLPHVAKTDIMNKNICLPVVMAAAFNHAATACTGITFKATDTSTVVARTIEWGGSYLASRYVVVPRGHSQQSYAPTAKAAWSSRPTTDMSA